MVLVTLIFFIIGALAIRRLFMDWMFPDVTSPVFMGGKTAVVTGGSSGLGYEIVLALASRGCRVIIADKNSDEYIKDEVINKTDNPNISIYHLDLSSFKSVREFADKLKKSVEKVDILFNNAGIGGSDDRLTEDGLNFVYQINYYGGFLLTHLLVDLLKKSNSARILFTSSPASYFHDLRGFDKKQLTTGASIHNYSSTKCLSIVCSDIFADKLKKYNITSNAWHPIGATTPIFQRCLNETKGGGNIALVYLLWFGARILTPEPRRAVLRAVYLACAKEMEGVTKGFFMPSGAARRPAIALNENFCQEVWDLSEEAVQLKREEKL